jgi:PPIC-type PPIASE domain
MHKWTALLFAALVIGAGTLVTWSNIRRDAPKPSASSDAGAPDGGAADPLDGQAPIEDGGVPGDPPSGETTEPGPQPDAGGTVLLSGEAAPALSADAPKSVVFGVVLVTYRGAQGLPGGPRLPATVRTREAALELAKQLAELAKTDFKAAVGKGDKPGSMDNAGRIPRGVLEPAPEYVLFSLAKGGVSEPVDTPRGYWIVQRIE